MPGRLFNHGKTPCTNNEKKTFPRKVMMEPKLLPGGIVKLQGEGYFLPCDVGRAKEDVTFPQDPCDWYIYRSIYQYLPYILAIHIGIYYIPVPWILWVLLLTEELKNPRILKSHRVDNDCWLLLLIWLTFVTLPIHMVYFDILLETGHCEPFSSLGFFQRSCPLVFGESWEAKRKRQVCFIVFYLL